MSSGFTDWFTELARAFAHGVTQGGLAEAAGGDFGSGFLGAFAGSLAGSAMASPKGVKHFGKPKDGNARLMVRRTVAAAVVGGTVAEIGGGKFANGAAAAAMVHLFNAEVEHNMNSKAEAARNHGVSSITDIGGGADVFSDLQVDLFFTEGTDLTAVADAIYDDLKVFAGFNESSEYGVILSEEGATFFDRSIPTPAPVRLTFYDHARVVVADTGGTHFLVGTRNFRVFQSGPNKLTLATGAIEHFNGAINRAAAVAMGFRSGIQHAIWKEYFSTIASRSGGTSGNFRLVERALD